MNNKTEKIDKKIFIIIIRILDKCAENVRSVF